LRRIDESRRAVSWSSQLVRKVSRCRDFEGFGPADHISRSIEDSLSRAGSSAAWPRGSSGQPSVVITQQLMAATSMRSSPKLAELHKRSQAKADLNFGKNNTAVFCSPWVSTSICPRPRIVCVCVPLSTPVRGKNRGKGDLLPRKEMRFGAFYHGFQALTVAERSLTLPAPQTPRNSAVRLVGSGAMTSPIPRA